MFIDLKLASSQWYKAELSGKIVSAGWDRTLIHEVYGHGFGNFDGEHYGHTKTVEMMNTIFRQMGSHYPAESTSPGYVAKRYQGAQSTIQSR